MLKNVVMKDKFESTIEIGDTIVHYISKNGRWLYYKCVVTNIIENSARPLEVVKQINEHELILQRLKPHNTITTVRDEELCDRAKMFIGSNKTTRGAKTTVQFKIPL